MNKQINVKTHTQVAKELTKTWLGKEGNYEPTPMGIRFYPFDGVVTATHLLEIQNKSGYRLVSVSKECDSDKVYALFFLE